MTVFLTLTNLKGGCGKSTLTIHFAAGLAKLGKKVLVIDHCSQGSSSHVFLPEDIDPKYTAKDLYYGIPLNQCIYQSTVPGVDIIPADMDLLNVNEDFHNNPQRNILLRNAIAAADVSAYDYVIMDPSPAMSIIVSNTLYATDKLIMPIDHIESLRSLGKYYGVIEEISSIKNASLQIDAIVMTMVKQDGKHFKNIRTAIEEVLPGKVCSTGIPHSLMFPEAQSENKTIYDYAPKSHFAAQYMKLTKELVQKLDD